jgi:uncharacterized DUF497 family protein
VANLEWDPEKESLNLRKHHLDFTTASLIWAGPVYERPDDRHDYGEVRIVALGEVEGHVLAVIFTWRRDVRRIISARKAKSREKRLFKEAIAHCGGAPPD